MFCEYVLDPSGMQVDQVNPSPIPLRARSNIRLHVVRLLLCDYFENIMELEDMRNTLP